MQPVDLFRRDGVTAYSHDVQVDAMGIAWVSGDGGTRGCWTQGTHYDPVQGTTRLATALQPIPYAGGGLPQSVTADYGEGTRFLDISDPANPKQIAYWRPDDGIVWASYLHRGDVYTADRTRGVDVLRLRLGATAARRASREVTAPPPSARQRRFLARVAGQYRTDRGTAGLLPAAGPVVA